MSSTRCGCLPGWLQRYPHPLYWCNAGSSASSARTASTCPSQLRGLTGVPASEQAVPVAWPRTPCRWPTCACSGPSPSVVCRLLCQHRPPCYLPHMPCALIAEEALRLLRPHLSSDCSKVPPSPAVVCIPYLGVLDVLDMPGKRSALRGLGCPHANTWYNVLRINRPRACGQREFRHSSVGAMPALAHGWRDAMLVCLEYVPCHPSGDASYPCIASSMRKCMSTTATSSSAFVVDKASHLEKKPSAGDERWQ